MSQCWKASGDLHKIMQRKLLSRVLKRIEVIHQNDNISQQWQQQQIQVSKEIQFIGQT